MVLKSHGRLTYVNLGVNRDTASEYVKIQLMKKIFAEVGFGNDTFLSTEFEEGESEYRVPGFVLPAKVNELYFRLWIFKRVFVLSTNNGFDTAKKDRSKLKILFGVGGRGE